MNNYTTCIHEIANIKNEMEGLDNSSLAQQYSNKKTARPNNGWLGLACLEINY